MKKLFPFVSGLILLLSSSAHGAPMCVDASLTNYINLGTGGCDIGTATLSGFSVLTPITGATPIAPGDVTLSPVQTGNMIGLDVRFQATAASGQLRQALIGYMLMAPSIIGDQVTISGVTTSGAAFATEIQNYCAGGSFLPNDVTGCTGSRTGTLLVLGNGTDMTALSTVTRLNVVHDFTLDAGSGGSVTGGLVSDRFTLGAAGNPGIPEPQTYVMVSSAILALVGLRRLKSKARTIGGQNENA